MLLPLSYNANRERTVSVESLVNLQPEVTFGGRQPVALVTCPGLKQFSMATNPGIGRGIIESRGTLYAVIGSYLYKFSSSGSATVVGNVFGAGLVGMSTSGTEIHIAASGSGYICDTNTETVTTITDPDYPAGTTSAFINGRFVTDDPTPGLLGRFYYSGLLDGSDWDALDFATSERKSDDAEAVWAFGESLVIFGTRSVEFWQGVADGYLPVPGALLPFGLLAKRSVAEAAGTLFFLDSDGQVRQMQGYQASIVSTPAVQFALAADSTAEGCAYVYEGRTIYEISTSTVTLAFDATSSAQLGRPVWFKRQTADGRHKQRGAVYCYGKTLSLGYDDGKVYELSRDVIPDVREFTVAIPVDDDARAWRVLDEVELVGRTGTGAIPDVDPQVMLRISTDNGYTEGEEKWVGLGTVGDYARRVRWRRLGRFLQMSMTFRQTDQYDWTVLGVRLRGR
jgi:hypothetical protein